jgi:chaperonin GroES
MKEENPSGIYPTEFKVLVKPNEVAAVTKGGIFIPETSKEREQYAQMEGTLVAVSPHAFTYAEWVNGADRPKVGDSVLFAKFAGAKVVGRDGIEYRLINDKDIGAVLDKVN